MERIKKSNQDMKKQRILFVSDYLPNEANSAAQILNRILNHFMDDNNEYVIYKHSDSEKLMENNIGSTRVYYSKQSNEKKCFGVFNRIRKRIHLDSIIQYLRLARIIIKEKPSRIVFFTFTPSKLYTIICRMNSILSSKEIYHILYDTYIGCPYFDFDSAYKKEKYVIDNSLGYFVPKFFFEEYNKIYKSSNIIPYDLPMLIDKKDVKKAYGNCEHKYTFGYFGQIQGFRNKDRIDDIFDVLNWRLKVFSDIAIEPSNSFDYMGGALNHDLYRYVAQSDFLVIFDNNEPFAHYLPSKAYLYISFTKPIIVFGENQTSAVKDFLENYPDWYYQNINSTTDGLLEFVNKQHIHRFDLKIYNQYTRYLPEVALTVMNKIFESRV